MGCYVVPTLPCAASLDPRRKGRCVRCDRPVPKSPEPLRRDLKLERDFIREAARGMCDPTALIEHAQARALRLSGEYVRDPLTIQRGRDRRRERREELVDFVNHALFDAQEHPEDTELWHDIQIEVRAAAILYDRLRG